MADQVTRIYGALKFQIGLISFILGRTSVSVALNWAIFELIADLWSVACLVIGPGIMLQLALSAAQVRRWALNPNSHQLTVFLGKSRAKERTLMSPIGLRKGALLGHHHRLAFNLLRILRRLASSKPCSPQHIGFSEY
jgi:hypothetical protein